MGAQGHVHVEQRAGLVEHNVRVHQVKEFGLRMGDRMHECVPRVVASGFLHLGYAARKCVGKRMALSLPGEELLRYRGRAIRAAVGDADHLAVFPALVQLPEEGLGHHGFKRSPDDGFFIPRPDGNGNARPCQGWCS
jgi:hypothetical protein